MSKSLWVTLVIMAVLIIAGALLYPTYSALLFPNQTLQNKTAQSIESQKQTTTNNTATPTETDTQATATEANKALVIEIKKDSIAGSYLVNNKGMTLYEYSKDKPAQSNCIDACIQTWSPLLADDQANGLSMKFTDEVQKKLGTFLRKDGKRQIMYGSQPLYVYTGDKKPGDILGVGSNPNWVLAEP